MITGSWRPRLSHHDSLAHDRRERAWRGDKVIREANALTVHTGPHTQFTWTYATVGNAKRAEKTLLISRSARERFVSPRVRRGSK